MSDERVRFSALGALELSVSQRDQPRTNSARVVENARRGPWLDGRRRLVLFVARVSSGNTARIGPRPIVLINEGRNARARSSSVAVSSRQFSACVIGIDSAPTSFAPDPARDNAFSPLKSNERNPPPPLLHGHYLHGER